MQGPNPVLDSRGQLGLAYWELRFQSFWVGLYGSYVSKQEASPVIIPILPASYKLPIISCGKST